MQRGAKCAKYWNTVQWMIVPMCSQRCIYNKYARKKAKRQKAMPQRCKRCICKVRWYSASEERASVVPHCGGRGGDDFRCLISNALPHPCLALHWGGEAEEIVFFFVGLASVQPLIAPCWRQGHFWNIRYICVHKADGTFGWNLGGIWVQEHLQLGLILQKWQQKLELRLTWLGFG